MVGCLAEVGNGMDRLGREEMRDVCGTFGWMQPTGEGRQ